MIASMVRLSSLLLGVALLLIGHGLQLAFVPLKAQLLSYSSVEIGLLSSAYFLGFVLGCLFVPSLVQRIGHIRTYSCLVATMASSILGLSFFSGFGAWILLRILAGCSIAGLYLVIESWLNEQASNEHRGATLAAYTVIVLVGLAFGQLLLNAAPIDGDRLVVIAALFIILATIPVSCTGTAQPVNLPGAKFSFFEVFRTSPTAAGGAMIGGLVSGTIYGLGPVYGIEKGLSVYQISLMMSFAIAGGALAQFPLGKLSDRIDRRIVLIACMAAGSMVSLVTFLYSGLIALSMMLLGASVMPLYAVSLALASDSAGPGSFIRIGTGLLMLNALASIVGPFVASQLMFRLNEDQFFLFHTLVLILGFFCLALLRKKDPIEAPKTADFTLATTAAAQAVLQLDPRSEPGETRYRPETDCD